MAHQPPQQKRSWGTEPLGSHRGAGTVPFVPYYRPPLSPNPETGPAPHLQDPSPSSTWQPAADGGFHAAMPSTAGRVHNKIYTGGLKWGFRNPDGALASPRVGFSPHGMFSSGRSGGAWAPGMGTGSSADALAPSPAGRVSQQQQQPWPDAMAGLDPHNPFSRTSGGRSQPRSSGHQASPVPPTSSFLPATPGHVSGAFLPTELPSQPIQGGHTTRDLGQSATQQFYGAGEAAADGVTRPFTEEAVTYKHGEAIILHQWEGSGDVLVNCQSPTPQAFICQYGISKGTMSWCFDISRTCDKFWFGVTTNRDLDCNAWIADHDAAYMVSEEAELTEATYDNYVPKSVNEQPARPSLVQRVGAEPTWVSLKSFAPVAAVAGVWASVTFLLDMNRCELTVQVRHGDGETTPRMRLFRNLPKGFCMYPCLSMCNAGQVVFTKYGR